MADCNTNVHSKKSVKFMLNETIDLALANPVVHESQLPKYLSVVKEILRDRVSTTQHRQ